MISFVDLTNFFIVSFGFTVSLLGLVFAILIRNFDKWEKRFLIILFGILTAYCISDGISQISLVMLGDNFTLLSKVAIFAESLFSSLLMPVISLYLLHLSGEGFKSLLTCIVSALWLLYFILLIITQFTSFIYYFTDDNVYHRGSFYPLLLIPPFLILLINMIALYLRRKKLPKRVFIGFFLYMFFPMLSMLLQMFSYGILLVILGSSISAALIFYGILRSQVEREVTQAIKLSEQKLMIQTLQLRPHFIYNTLSNIYYLCKLDPKKAQLVVDDFSTYLKKNFSAMAKEGLVSFEEELEHAKAYLSVVKARYEELIFVTFDTEYTSFRIPPLTLEPIVENAVKHGLDPDSDPLNILIRTSRGAKENIIVVENTGADFTIQPKDDEPHIGLTNVAERLKNLCGGSLDIKKRSFGGTIVTITIPFRRR